MTARQEEREREREMGGRRRDRRKEDLQLKRRRRRLIVLKVETAIELASFISCSGEARRNRKKRRRSEVRGCSGKKVSGGR